MIGRLGRVPPFVFVDEPLGCMWDVGAGEFKQKLGLGPDYCIS